MGRIQMTTLVAVGLLGWCSSFAAGCDLLSYDQTPPAAVKDIVDNQYARFEWATDDDIVGGRHRIWNYLLNTGRTSLGADWDKGQIHISLLNPLPPGSPFCYRHFIRVQAQFDSDAPILYGTNSMRQDAAAYVDPSQTKGEATRSIVETTFLDESGKPRSVAVEIGTAPTKSGFQLFLYRPSDLTVGISRLPSVLSRDQIESMIIDFGKQGTKVQIATVQTFVGEKLLESAFPWSGLKDRLAEPYLFLTGGDKTIVSVNDSSFKEQSADMIVLDKDRRPLFVSGVTMLAPTRR